MEYFPFHFYSKHFFSRVELEQIRWSVFLFLLKQATGGVLVSQEPSKVILYRGWGAFDEPGKKGKKNAQNIGKTSVGKEERSRVAGSRELMAAIRLECGLQNKQEQKPTPLPEIWGCV